MVRRDEPGNAGRPPGSGGTAAETRARRPGPPAAADLLVRARAAAAEVVDPELPMLTLLDLGVLRDVTVEGGRAVVTITPTYLGCPAMETMRADLLLALRRAGLDARVRVRLSPPWTSDDISEEGRRRLAEHRIAPPARGHRTGPVPVPLGGLARREDGTAGEVPCPCCGAARTTEVSAFGSTACRAIRRCPGCGETFDHVREHR